MEKAPRLGSPLRLGVCAGDAHSRERIKLSLVGRTHVDCQDGRRVGSLNAGIHTTLECANMPALLNSEMSPQLQIAAVILVAGESSRLGPPQKMCPIPGETVVRR